MKEVNSHFKGVFTFDARGLDFQGLHYQGGMFLAKELFQDYNSSDVGPQAWG